MPRNPAAKKNQHNNRHENGLVGPGKRVTKQRSNGHLNGSVKPTPPDEPLPVTANSEVHPSVHQAVTSSLQSRSEAAPELRKRASESSTDGQEQKWEAVAGNASLGQRRTEMAVKSKSLTEVNAMQVASTILRSCPAGDTIALLIVLLALPSMVLTIVQALFASLTLVPPTNLSPVSFLSLFDVFQGSTGSPSLGTMAAVDVICFGLWICLWGWAQNFALDLAQIQIAITLGNGNSGKNGTVNLFCFALVLVQHSIRSRGVRRFFVSNLVPANFLSHPRIAELAQFLPAEGDFGDSPGPPSKLRNLFAIHILSQAFMAFIRRRVAHSQSGTTSKTTKRSDPEAYAGSSNTLEPLNVDAANAIAAAASGVDFQPPPTPGYKDPKDKSNTAKKRRRQANQVRIRQPFWAALASTKVHVLREVEHKKGHPNPTDFQNLNPSLPQENVWVTNVEPSTIQFEAMYAVPEDQDQESSLSTEMRPIFVRINGARWHSVSLDPTVDCDAKSGLRQQWSGTISGLAPDCTYTCSFNSTETEVEFASIMVKTPAITDGDLPNALAPAPARGSLRPSSPSTTLKNSIQTAEARLNEARARLTKSKRMHKGGLSRVEKEVESLHARLKSSSDDTKQRQKLLQAERSMRQTEDATKSIIGALGDLESIPEDESQDYNTKKGIYNDQNRQLNAATEVLESVKTSAKNELAVVNGELSSVTSRKDRLVGRQAKLAEQHDRITQANVQGLNEKERKAAESAAIEVERQRRETEMTKGVNALLHDIRELSSQIQTNHREIDILERQAFAQREMMLHNSGPLTPEGNLPGTNPPQIRSFGFSSYPSSNLANTSTALSFDPQSSPFLAYANTLSNKFRPRSNTNRSNGANSTYSADLEDADPIPPTLTSSKYDHPALNGRNSSGSSREKNNGSPAGVIGDGPRGSQRGSHSPIVHGTNSW